MVLAFLRRHEAALLACGEDTLPETISNLRFTGNVEVRFVCVWGGGVQSSVGSLLTVLLDSV